MILDSFRIVAGAMFQIFLLAFCGYVLTKKKILSAENLKALSQLLIGVLLPCFIFVKFVENFSFAAFPRWWVFPLLSCFVTLVGFVVGKAMLAIDSRLRKFQSEFISLVAFQNSGYLPLILVALLLSTAEQGRMFIYILLFLLGFNLVVWSLGVFYLTKEKGRRMQMGSLFSAPVLAIIVSFVFIATGLQHFIPRVIMSPVKMLGECVLPLAMIVVGGNLSYVKIRAKENIHAIGGVVLAKLFIMPLLFFVIIFALRPTYEVAFLLLIQGAVPSATSLSLIMRNYEKKDNIISAGIFWTHTISLLTIPVFLVLFNLLRYYLR